MHRTLGCSSVLLQLCYVPWPIWYVIETSFVVVFILLLLYFLISFCTIFFSVPFCTCVVFVERLLLRWNVNWLLLLQAVYKLSTARLLYVVWKSSIAIYVPVNAVDSHDNVALKHNENWLACLRAQPMTCSNFRTSSARLQQRRNTEHTSRTGEMVGNGNIKVVWENVLRLCVMCPWAELMEK